MAAVYKRDLETLYEELSGYLQNAEDLLRQNPNAERNDGDPEPMTRRIFTLNAENLYKRIHDLINEMSNTKEGWAAYIHSRSGAELSKANEDYSNFTLGPDGQKKHFTSYIREAKAAMRNISEAIMQQDVRENGGDRENPENPQEQENPEIQDNPENREDVERIRPVIQTVDLTQAPPVGLQVPDYTQPPPRVQAAAQEQQNFVQQTDSTLLLPRMKPPVFSGKSEQWLAFWEIFEASVHNKGISNVEKMSYLITLLEGEAKRAVSGYQICNANYLVVVELLKNRFGNKEAIAESLQAELIALPKAAENTHSLRNFSEAVERICRQMKAMSLSDDHPVIATAIKTKLPYNIIMKLIEKERASGIKWTATQIRQGLQEIIAVREEVQRNINEKNHTHTPNFNRESTRAFPLTMNENSKGNQKSRCYFCGKGMHWKRVLELQTAPQHCNLEDGRKRSFRRTERSPVDDKRSMCVFTKSSEYEDSGTYFLR
ncbi:hypothetical protein DdX_07836 [Ditylenchus destructor]|uniref:Gag protein n=1 Tax=Ditylenchus destructor TaxID=166010 RepID=A0AAD4N5C8_9BILA|nr:hypothetical protein DdX_07836 [Ditylenchus destructor]